MRRGRSMDGHTGHVTDRHLRTPRAAAIAGIVFAVLFAASYWLIYQQAPGNSADFESWLAAHAETVTWGVSLLPFLTGTQTERVRPLGFLNKGGNESVWMTHRYKLISTPKGLLEHLFGQFRVIFIFRQIRVILVHLRVDKTVRRLGISPVNQFKNSVAVDTQHKGFPEYFVLDGGLLVQIKREPDQFNTR